MKKLQLNHNDQQKLVRYFEKITQILLHLYTYVNLTPTMIEIHNLTDYAYNVHLMIQEFYKTFQKKFVSIQVFKKIENQLNQKNQKITNLMNLQKNLKIQLKVMEDKLIEAENKLNLIDHKKQLTLPERIRKNILEKEKQTSIQQISKLEKTSMQIKRKRMSLPHLPSSSTNLGNKEKFINATKRKKNLFVSVPGQGNEVLIQHLMSKISTK